MFYRLTETTAVTSADYMLNGTHSSLLVEGLEAVNKHSGMALDTDAVARDVMLGTLRNLTILDENFLPIGFVFYHVTKAGYDIDLGLHVVAMYMRPKHADVTDALIEFLKTLAANLGANKVVGISRRKGWAKRMKPDNLLQLGIWDISHE